MREGGAGRLTVCGRVQEAVQEGNAWKSVRWGAVQGGSTGRRYREAKRCKRAIQKAYGEAI